MFALYNLILLLLSPLLLLALPVLLLRRPEKRGTILPRLGIGMAPAPRRPGSPVVWIHALSVGELTSALPVLQALRTAMPHATLVLSVTTVSGKALAERQAAPFVDALYFFPFDLRFAVKRCIEHIKPDLFVLVETDFWPNFLRELAAAEIPAVLINGRISQASFAVYRRFSFFFRPLFDTFAFLCMQTEAAAALMQEIGISPEKLRILGNLKYTVVPRRRSDVRLIRKKEDGTLVMCASTHEGEEELLIRVFTRLLPVNDKLQLAIAPRDPKRSGAIEALVGTAGHTVSRYSEDPQLPCDIVIIDTLGDLPLLFENADLAFIGGSIVPEGGHNPLEAIRHGCPVIFGPHMEDFTEIRSGLLDAGAAFEVTDIDSCESVLKRLISSPELREAAAAAARVYAGKERQILDAHLQVISELL